MSDGVPVDVVEKFLDANSTLTLACTDREGPWAADVYFVRSGRSFLFFSSPASRHSEAFAVDSSAAGTVHGACEGWRDIRGVQMSGTVTAVSSAPERIRVTALYLLKFHFARDFIGESGKVLEGKVALFRFTPTELFWVDNSNGLSSRAPVAW